MADTTPTTGSLELEYKIQALEKEIGLWKKHAALEKELASLKNVGQEASPQMKETSKEANATAPSLVDLEDTDSNTFLDSEKAAEKSDGRNEGCHGSRGMDRRNRPWLHS